VLPWLLALGTMALLLRWPKLHPLPLFVMGGVIAVVVRAAVS